MPLRFINPNCDIHIHKYLMVNEIHSRAVKLEVFVNLMNINNWI